MNRIRSALPWNKKNYYGDSDSTGYCSSSDVSKALSGSQFILRPNTALLSCAYSNCTNYYALDYSELSTRNERNPTISSMTSSTISSSTIKTHSMNTNGSLEGDDEDEGEEEEEEDDDSTIRANSVRHVPMMPKLTSIRHFKANEPSKIQEKSDEELETLDEITTSYEEEEEDDDEITIDVGIPKTFKNSSFRSFPFSYQLVENEMDRLFDMLQVDEQVPSTSNSSETDCSRRKRLLIKEPTSTIYYHEQSEKTPIPKPRSIISRTDSVPKSILKSNTSTFAIYEEIYGDHLTPPPVDIRPELPQRPIRAFQKFPPCTAFSPRQPHRIASIRRRKKLPSLHHSTSFSSYFRRKK